MTELFNDVFIKRRAQYGIALLAADKSLGVPGSTGVLEATPAPDKSWKHGVAGLVVLRAAPARSTRSAKTKRTAFD